MKDLQLFDYEKTMTTKEIAAALGTTDRTIRRHAAKLKLTENGKQTRLTEKQVTMIKKMIDSHDLDRSVQLDNKNTDYEMMMLDKKVSEWKTAKIAELESQLKSAQPKIEFYDTVMDSTDTVDMKDAAKILNLPYGRNILFEILRNKKILMVDNQPYQEYINRGYFRVIERPWTLPNGGPKISKKTVVYQKGLEYIKKVVSE